MLKNFSSFNFKFQNQNPLLFGSVLVLVGLIVYFMPKLILALVASFFIFFGIAIILGNYRKG